MLKIIPDWMRLPLLSIFSLLLIGISTPYVTAGPYPPAAGQEGSTAIHMDDPTLVSWANAIVVIRGPQDISRPEGGDADFGSMELALGPASGESFDVVSLGDGGGATLAFATPIVNGPGFDFAVFENGFVAGPQPGLYYLELGHVAVSSNGEDFFRFPSVSLTQTDGQISGFAPIDPTDISGFAGKYEIGYGTPFDLEDLAGTPGLDLEHVRYVRIIDVVGSIDDRFATYDSLGNKINDPWPTPFSSGGFDLEAVGVIHTISCEGDFDFDADVDAVDLDRLRSDPQLVDLATFADNFGCGDCND